MERSKRANFKRHGRLAVLAATLLSLFACSNGPGKRPEIPITSLANGIEPLRDAFNQDVGKVRLLLLLDPT